MRKKQIRFDTSKNRKQIIKVWFIMKDLKTVEKGSIIW